MNFKPHKGGQIMVERQTIVTWHEPSEKCPPDDSFVVVTISGKAGNVTYDHACAIVSWVPDEGWYIEGFDPDESDANITVNA